MKRPSRPLQIAIDGPVSAGKGTVARSLAERLGIVYVDTGAMYRSAALLAQSSGIPLEDSSSVVTLLSQARIEIRPPTLEEQDGRLTTVLLNGEDVSWKIRGEAVGLGASIISQHPEVRAILVARQREMVAGQSVVMEGRDITTRVLPDAPFRIFLTASPEVRARRRQQQLRERGIGLSYKKVLADLRRRDEQDSARKADPLRVAHGAWVLDTSDLTIQQVVERIVDKIEKSGLLSGGEEV
ncbi:MAG: cytidylate kinase [Candidatus Chisholmbacteria bacterium RIFCSPHIGHO2_12_FULL_49_9]|uniref:Cytidylate kinase n=1 Tax=Candidatus Chisholmbacteria bacterium RIFCSPHIGHO2_01_FULL_52_32 TaxID=1797591 RepID=A0A1G1VQY2_9BACT|nr:MAG: cytidylate kinase [Candidatus Chisholmbacteria bacterium RIFCSPHIGHO2_01_FULL_52_32]OGY19007.1 MAG: cytidylate kinase [Candidatus Chisholmbacteria bacterium RIFCSPHIGHO2_12_FULL_49_9]OGY19533.1 MAG: cytidylate kinase [Candidatus Chisholmbacteria bacterium RIFCSPLOWO2_01_FULL_50_28]